MATRTEQKARTRQVIVDAAAQLVAAGVADPSMDDIAAAAKVGRATVYRYFDNAIDVLWQATSDRALTDIAARVESAGDDLVERVLAAEDVINGYLFGDIDGARVFEHATLDRRLRRVGLDDDRAARRLIAIDAALTPMAGRLTAEDLARVRHALALTMGTHATLAMVDTCRLDADAGREATRLTCRLIAEEALRLARQRPGRER